MISCDVFREDLSVPYTGFGYPFCDSLKSLAEVYYGNELRVLIWRIISMSRHIRIVHSGNLTFIYISGTIQISYDRRIIYMWRSRLIWFNLNICGRHNLWVDKFWTRKLFPWQINLNLESPTIWSVLVEHLGKLIMDNLDYS